MGRKYGRQVEQRARAQAALHAAAEVWRVEVGRKPGPAMPFPPCALLSLLMLWAGACGGGGGDGMPDGEGEAGAAAPSPPDCSLVDSCVICGAGDGDDVFEYYSDTLRGEVQVVCTAFIAPNPAIVGKAEYSSSKAGGGRCSAGAYTFELLGGSARVQNANTGKTLTLPCTRSGD